MPQNKPEDMSDDELRKALGLDDDPDYAGNMSSEEVAAYLNAMANEDLQSAWDDFDQLMLDLPEHLNRLEQQIAASQFHHTPAIRFSKGPDELYEDEKAFNRDSVAQVESFLLDVLNGKEPFDSDLLTLKLAVGLFLGEAIAENLEGEWMICEDKQSVDYGKPVVALWEGEGYGPPLNPFDIVELLAQTRRKGILYGAINGMQQGSTKG